MSERRFGYRWTICALLFAATTLNYVDRQVLGVLGPTLQRELHWTESQYGDIVSWFSLPYAIAFAFVGRWLDRVGVRRGLATAVIGWSLAAIAHGFARTTARNALAPFLARAFWSKNSSFTPHCLAIGRIRAR